MLPAGVLGTQAFAAAHALVKRAREAGEAESHALPSYSPHPVARSEAEKRVFGLPVLRENSPGVRL